jgi:hypothetical protein
LNLYQKDIFKRFQTSSIDLFGFKNVEPVIYDFETEQVGMGVIGSYDSRKQTRRSNHFDTQRK